jgi:DNA-binding NarL/FixJ family response regulator
MPIRVLLVDDNRFFVEFISHFLAAEPDIEVIGHALTGREGVEKSAASSPDLVLMDLAMPEMNGLEVTRRIRAQPDPPYVVILTLYDNLEYRKAAAAVGASGYVVKSDLTTQLLPLIRSLFGHPSTSEQESRGGEGAGHKTPPDQQIEVSQRLTPPK